MVENKTRKIERNEIIVCGACNNAISKELLEKSVGGVNNLYCQYCGVSLNLTHGPNDNNGSSESPNITIYNQEESNRTNIQQNRQESDFSLSYSNIRNALRSYIFQLIYQLLKCTPLTLKKIQSKKELKSSHINIVLKKIWKELKDLNPNDITNHKLVSSKRRIKIYFDEFQSTLRSYKQFRKSNFALFAENIEFIFGLILGDYEFSNLTTSKKRIVLDLKKHFGFKSDTTTTNSFTYSVSLIISKKIHSIINQYHISEGSDNKLAFDEIISYVIENLVNNKKNSCDKSELNSSKKKKLHKTLEILISNLKTDWIYRRSFEDHIYKLIIIVNSLTSDADYSSSLTGFERLISQGLKQSALFEKDQDFSPHFKLNLTLILCRVIYLKIKKSPKMTKSSFQSVNLSITDENIIKNSILDEITAGKKINSQFLKKFYKLSLEEFQTYYEKLQYKMTSDLIYVENFRDYISDLVRLVFNIIHSISKKFHLTKLELAVIKDLANYNFDWFYKKPGRTYFYYLNLYNQSSEDKKSINLTDSPVVFNKISMQEIEFLHNKRIELTELNSRGEWIDKLNYKESSKRFNILSNLVVDNTPHCQKPETPYTRHNYMIVSNFLKFKELSCIECGNVIGIYKLQNTENIFNKKLNRLNLIKLEKRKGPNDLAIYSVRFKKDADGNYLKFPGLIYCGKSIQQVKEEIRRKYKGRHGELGEYIKNFDFKNVKDFMSHLYIDVLQIIRYNGNKESTLKRVDQAEMFWIGFYKSQFKELGLNVEEGGSNYFIPRKIIPLSDLEAAFYDLIYKNGMYHKNQGPRDKLMEILGVTREDLLPNLQWSYGTVSIVEIIRGKVKILVRVLFEKGYNPTEISVKLPLDFGEIGARPDYAITKMIKEIYENTIPNIDNLRINEVRDIILSKKIEEKIREGYTTYKSLLLFFPGLRRTSGREINSIKEFVGKKMGGLKNLIEENKVDINKKVFTAAKQLIIQNQGNYRYAASSILKDLIDMGVLLGYSKGTVKGKGPYYFEKIFEMSFKKFKKFCLKNRLC